MAETTLNPELNKQVLIKNLERIFDADFTAGLGGLEAFIASNGVRDNLKAAIEMFGKEEQWLGNLVRGMKSPNSKFFSLQFCQPPIFEGGSVMISQTYDHDDVQYMLVLPFNQQGQIDRTRETRAWSFYDPRTFTIAPYSAFRSRKEEVETCEAITWVTKLTAFDLLRYIEREWPSTLEEQLAAL